MDKVEWIWRDGEMIPWDKIHSRIFVMQSNSFSQTSLSFDL